MLRRALISTLWGCGLLAWLAATVNSVSADTVVYREIFPNSNTGSPFGRNISDADWQAYWTSGAVQTPSPVNVTIMGQNANAGKPTDATPINSNPSNTELVNGWVFFHTNFTNLVFTTESGLVDQAIPSSMLSEVSWYAGNSLTTVDMRAAIKVDSNWYGSQQVFNMTTAVASGSNFGAEAEHFILSVSPSTDWHPMTFTVDTELSINTGSTVSLPNGAVTGVGLYSVGGGFGTSMRFDTFSVAANLSSLVPGDFNGDGNVDGADFVIWQTNFPKAEGGMLDTGDANGDGAVDGADFVVWQTNFPFTPSAGTNFVPEPFAWTLAAIGGAFVMMWRRRK
ncbi:MAG: hypothetical protein IT427_14315 [Pirellulales bacterium]|nr:hypothetical protein [Pirellulales bacterium]